MEVPQCWVTKSGELISWASLDGAVWETWIHSFWMKQIWWAFWVSWQEMRQALQEIKSPPLFLFSPLNKFLPGTSGDIGYTWPMDVSGLTEEANHLNKFFLGGFWDEHRRETLICKCDGSIPISPDWALACCFLPPNLLWARFLWPLK